jgi:peptide/nickel transport system permease protein
MYFIPGDPVEMMLGPDSTQAQIEVKRNDLGLNESYLVRLSKFLGDIIFHFDFGNSWVYNTSVTTELMKRLPRTLTLATMCIILQIVIGIPLGIIAAINHNSWEDKISMFIILIGVSLPNFWIAIMLILFFSLRLEWFPPYGIGGFKYYILPTLANAFPGIVSQARQTRSSILEVIRSDYITTARAKGMTEIQILMKHTLPNALLPVITVIGNGMSMMLAGTVVIESIFSIPGVGMYLVGGINNRDYAVVQSSVIFLSIVFSIIMLVVDLLYALIDPRIKGQFITKTRRRDGYAK